MSNITIHCRLIAPSSTRQHLWQLMSDLNTPLINDLLQAIPQHPDFEQWCQNGKMPTGVIKELCQPLKSIYSGQPARFYTSAIALVSYVYKAWLTRQKQLYQRLEGQKCWLNLLKTNSELIKESNHTLEEIRAKAKAILDKLPEDYQFKNFFKLYEQSNNSLEKTAISYLLKNQGKIPEKQEKPEQILKRRHQIQIKIKQLQKKLDASPPKGRDLTGDNWLNTLLTATNTVPQDEEQAKYWQDILLSKTKYIPFPVSFETNTDLIWSKNKKGSLCVQFSGLSKYKFEIYCDQRQLKYFERFYQDQEIKRASKNQHSSALFTLRSGRILWKETTAKGQAWDINHLYLYCSLDTDLWTIEGTEKICQEKNQEINKILEVMEEKEELNDKQQAFIKRKNSTLAKINHSFPRPSKPLYQGQENLILGVALGLEQTATIAIINSETKKVITYRNLKQLLGDNYKLINRQRQQKANILID